MKVLLVQPYGDNGGYDLQEVYENVKFVLEDSREQVDLIVFPEGFAYVEDVQQECWDLTMEIAHFYGVPVVVGASTAEGTEEAYYFNPNVDPNNPQGDSLDKLYIKHSTAQRVYFDYNFDEATDALVYKPFMLNGLRVQLCICHDMFYPLLMERLVQEGMDVLINLTGGNVKMSKWNTLLRGRSLEIDGAVICTMGNRTSMKQKSDRIVYDKGDRLVPIWDYGDGEIGHAYSIFDLGTDQYFIEDEPFYSNNQYTDFTVGYEEEDVVLRDGRIESKLAIVESFNNAYRFKKGDEIVYVHVAGEAELFDRTFIYKQPRCEHDHYVFIYVCDEIDYSHAVTMARMRAIENRVAVVIATPDFTLGAKTNRYKDVQLFRSVTIGFDLAHMYGFDSVYEKNARSINGLNVVFKDKYERLIEQGQMSSKQLCLKREFPILMTPEENVRQSLLKEILQVVDRDNVEVEYLIKKLAMTDEAVRADIIVFSEANEPLIVIECKEPNVALTLTVKEQVMHYNTFLQAPYIALTNGKNTEIYEWVEGEYKQISTTRIVDVLNDVEFTYDEEETLERLSFEESTARSMVRSLVSDSYISPVSVPKMQAFYGELLNALLTDPFEAKYAYSCIEHIEDLGYGYYGFQNGSGKGGRFNFDYRNFKVTIGGETVVYRLTIAAAGSTSDDPVYGNRKGSTGLCVGIQQKAHNAHVLELNLDTFTSIEGDYVNIHHNGRGLQKHGIVEEMKNKYPRLMHGNQIVLGRFPMTKSIETAAFSYFIEAVITYCHTRAQLKERVKVGK